MQLNTQFDVMGHMYTNDLTLSFSNIMLLYTIGSHCLYWCGVNLAILGVHSISCEQGFRGQVLAQLDPDNSFDWKINV
jgi:hypothetical protein